jgi:hypothetical protein
MMNQPSASSSIWSGWQTTRTYIGNIRDFQSMDWYGYLGWIGTLASLFVGVTMFLIWGTTHSVTFPGYVWVIPVGIGLFLVSLAIDDIGHRTLYKEQLRKGEGHVHKMIAFTAITSVIALCLCYEHGITLHTPAIVLICLSLFYSAIDEALHWQRYLSFKVDVVEMWSHFGAILGHTMMIFCWWQWYTEGYAGVAETVATLQW